MKKKTPVLLDDALKMSMKVNRTGWARLGIFPVETVGDHTFLAACLAIILCDIRSLPHDDILPIVIYHDVAEVLTGDIPLDVAKLLSNKAEFEINAIDELLQDDKLVELKEMLLSYYRKESIYTSFIKNIDILATLTQALLYEMVGWKGLDDFWINYETKGGDFFKPIFEALKKYRNHFIFNSVGNEDSIVSYYENIDYAERHNKLLDRFTNNVYIEIFDSYLNCTDYKIETSKVLDIGAGTGRFSEWFRIHNNSMVTSMDINPSLLSCIPENSRSRTLKWNINTPWPFSDESQDVVLCGEVLEHLFRPDFVLKEAYRVLRADGCMFISVPDSNHPSRKDNLLRYGYPEPPEKRNLFEEHIQIFTPATIIKGLENSGFKPLAMCWYDLQSGKHTEFINLENSLSIDDSLMRHIFIIARKRGSLPSDTGLQMNFSSLLEIVKMLNRAKYMSNSIYKEISIAEEYLIKFSNVALNIDSKSCADQYRLLLINCLRDCYLAGASEVIKKDILTIPDLNESFLGLSKEIELVYKSLFE